MTTKTIEIHDAGADNGECVTAMFSPYDSGYKYNIFDGAKLIAYGWVRSRDERTLRVQLEHLVRQLDLGCGRNES